MEEIKIAGPEELKKINLGPLPTRPSQSKYFNQSSITLRSNHYNIVVPKSMEIFVYDFKFNPDIDRDNRRQVRYYLKCFNEQIEKQLGKFEYSGWMMFASKKVENLTLTSEIDKSEVKMELKFTKQCQNLKEIMSISQEKSESAKQIINIIIKNCFKQLGFKEIGLRKNFFDISKKKVLQNLFIEMWLGFYTSTEYFQSGPKLTIDCASKILRLDTALDYMNSFQTNDQNYIKDNMVYTSVIAYYGNYRTYQIHDVDFKKTPLSKFDTPNGPISFADYYKDRYKITIKNMKQPLLLHNKRERTPDGKRIIVKIYLIPEIVRMTGLTDDMRRNRGCMKQIADEKPTSPGERVQEIQNFVQKLQGAFNKSFWNLQLQASEQIEGILMQQPEIMLGNKAKAKPMNGQFRLQGSVYDPAQFNSKWVLLYLEQGQRDYDAAENFVQTMQKSSGRFGILLNEPEYLSVQSTNPKDYFTTLINYLQKNKPLIVVSLIRRKNNVEIYKAIKQACYISSKNSNIIPSQNVLMETLQKNAMSVCSNILLQMNAKMNLAVWLVQPVKNLPQNVMLIGADVHHKKGNRSIVGFCATMNSNFSGFYSRATEQEKDNYEIMKQIGKFVFEGLLAYFAKNKQLPETIIFFRDGVGDSQIDEVRNSEIKQVLYAFQQIKEKFQMKIYEPKFAEIIVKKKINDKFFVENAGQGQRRQGQPSRGEHGAEKSAYTNVPSGTIVNSSVVSNNFDYYMVAQFVNQGTATPTHYNVIYNTTDLTEDQFLELTFRQCFNYFNWQGAIKIPSVVKYADKLAFFYGTYLKRESDPGLFEFLYYL